jgi:hypothetical protein
MKSVSKTCLNSTHSAASVYRNAAFFRKDIVPAEASKLLEKVSDLDSRRLELFGDRVDQAVPR